MQEACIESAASPALNVCQESLAGSRQQGWSLHVVLEPE